MPVANVAGRPGVNATGGYSEVVDAISLGVTPDRQLAAGVNLSVPLYSGGSVKNQVRAAERRVEDGQFDLRGTESAVFSQTIDAHMDVILKQAAVGLNRKNVAVLSLNLEAARDCFEISDLTRTDVAQSEARLAVARSDTGIAEAQLANARERYIQLVGKPPTDLEPPPLPGLPAAPEDR